MSINTRRFNGSINPLLQVNRANWIELMTLLRLDNAPPNRLLRNTKLRLPRRTRNASYRVIMQLLRTNAPTFNRKMSPNQSSPTQAPYQPRHKTVPYRRITYLLRYIRIFTCAHDDSIRSLYRFDHNHQAISRRTTHRALTSANQLTFRGSVITWFNTDTGRKISVQSVDQS